MHKVEFKFKCGDHVEIDTGTCGVVIACVEEFGSLAYRLDCSHGYAQWYHPKRLKLTDRRPTYGFKTLPDNPKKED